VRGRIEAVLDWATVRGYRAGDNPARWRGHLDKLLPAKAKVRPVEHHPALPFAEAPDFMARLRAEGGTAAQALAFLILTAARSSEVRHATWDEIDLGGATWTVPEARTKSGREHRVPLGAEAVGIIESMAAIRESDFVFPGGRRGHPLSENAMIALLRRMGRADVTPHGFRSTFRDWAGERTNYPREVAEAALAHVVQDKTEAAYRRGDALDKRRRLMADWAKYLARPVGTTGKVVSLNRRGAGR
jgi:integrase